MVASLLWSSLQALGGYIIGHRLESASETYGFFAVVIGLLTWLFLGGQVTLIAGEVNVVRTKRLWPRSLDPEDLTEADRRTLRELAEVEERRGGAGRPSHLPGPERPGEESRPPAEKGS